MVGIVTEVQRLLVSRVSHVTGKYYKDPGASLRGLSQILSTLLTTRWLSVSGIISEEEEWTFVSTCPFFLVFPVVTLQVLLDSIRSYVHTLVGQEARRVNLWHFLSLLWEEVCTSKEEWVCLPQTSKPQTSKPYILYHPHKVPEME
jgi:hypothetical protein